MMLRSLQLKLKKWEKQSSKQVFEKTKFHGIYKHTDGQK